MSKISTESFQYFETNYLKKIILNRALFNDGISPNTSLGQQMTPCPSSLCLGAPWNISVESTSALIQGQIARPWFIDYRLRFQNTWCNFLVYVFFCTSRKRVKNINFKESDICINMKELYPFSLFGWVHFVIYYLYKSVLCKQLRINTYSRIDIVKQKDYICTS